VVICAAEASVGMKTWDTRVTARMLMLKTPDNNLRGCFIVVVVSLLFILNWLLREE
jgi:hypothetical protein